MRYLISTILIALLLWSCDNTPADLAKPQMVRKKIVAAKDNTAKVSTKKTVRTAKTKPDAKQLAKTVVAKVDQTQAKQKKPAISPKPEITDVKPAVKNQEQPGGGKTVAEIKVKPSEPVAAAKSLPGGIPPIYDPTGKIDPFEPLFREKQVLAKNSKKIKRVPRTPLERIDLSQLKLVGIILAASGNRALVEESSGKGYIIKKGTYIGINGGIIVQIQKDIVTVEEKFEDFSGKIQSRNRELKLPKPPGEF